MLAVGLATAARWWLRDELGTEVQFITYHPAVALVAMLAGGGPALLATILGAFVVERMIGLGTSSSGVAVSLLLFGASGVIVGSTAELLRRTRRRQFEDLAAEVAARTRHLEDANRRLLDEAAAGERTKRALRENEARLRLFIEYAPAALAMFDSEMRYLAVSRRWRDDYALGDQDLIGRSHYEVFPEISDGWKSVHRRGLAGEVIEAREDRFERADGGVQWLNWVVRPWHAPGGEIGGIVVFTEDITRRRQAQADLAQSESLLREAQRLARIGSWRWELHETLPVWSAEQFEIFGRDPARGPVPVGEVSRYFTPRSWERVSTALGACIQKGTPYELDVEIVREDGSHGFAVARGEAVRSAAGSIVGLQGMMQDITERRERETVLREKRALEEDDRRKDAFLAMLGHELRNPLAALDLELRLLAEGVGDADRARHRMSSHVRHLTRLVNDLLDVSRIKQGKPVVRTARIDLVDVVCAAANATEHDVHDRRQTLVLLLPESLVIEGDPTRLEQVAANLISNASKYSPEKGNIEVSLRPEHGQAVLSVRDDGRGFDPEQRAQLFEPFTQADPLAGGLGIGLALAKGLIEQHGGSIEAQSEGPGSGSCFIARLPVGNPVMAAPDAPRASIQRLPRPVRVLVVEDVHDTAEALTRLLQTMGAEAVCAYSAAAGIEKARSWRPEVALVDLGLPDMPGYEVARAIRAQEGGEHVLLLAATGFGDETSRARALGVGFDERLLKPLDPADLHQRIVAWMGHGAASGNGP